MSLRRSAAAEARRGRLLSVEAIAGWVFADLLLVLVIVGLGSAVSTEPPAPVSTSPSPSPSTPPTINGMATKPADILIDFDAAALVGGDRTEATRVCADVRRKEHRLRGEKAALVLIFSGAPESTQGQAVSTAVGQRLKCADATLFPSATVIRPFWWGRFPYGRSRIEVYVFTTTQHAHAG